MPALASARNTPLDYALAYAAMGWPVVPLHWITSDGKCSCGQPHDGKAGAPNGKGKHPFSKLAPNGVDSATTDADTLRRWFGAHPMLNVGVAMGRQAGVVAVDIDPRDGGDATWDAFLDRNGAKCPDTVIAQTGGGGQHILFRYDEAVRVPSPGKGVQIKGEGGYIVVEPSRHHSGGTYCWDSESDPLEGVAAAAIPAWLAAPKSADIRMTSGRPAALGYLHPDRISELRSALACIDADEYHQWIEFGQALHSTDAPEAFALWDEWSQASDKYDANVLRKKWAGFGREGVHVETIFKRAYDAGWQGVEPAPVAIETVQVAKAAPAVSTPTHLLTIPGALGAVVDLYNRTSPKPQPQFAVQTALAFGATVLGRRWKTTRENWPSLYLVQVGKSASGKEHGRTVIDACLSASELSHLIGPSGYTSDSGVFSFLHHQPSHIAIIDELGDLLGNAQAQGNFHKRQAITAMVQAWGLLHGTLRPQGYSTMALQQSQRQEAAARCVHRPALTLLGMTTPKTFYDSLSEQAIEGGFLNRLLIVESTIGRQMSRPADPLTVPDAISAWCHAARSGNGGNLTGYDCAADQVPAPSVVDFAPEAAALFRTYEAACLAAMDRLEAENLAELEGRSLEKALRIALIIAVSCDPLRPVITAEHARWAIAYVTHYTDQTTAAVRRYMHGSQFAKWQSTTLESLLRAGAQGLTERELCRNCRVYAGLEPRMRKSVMESLKAQSLAALVDLGKGHSGRGRSRIAWLATHDEETHDDAE